MNSNGGHKLILKCANFTMNIPTMFKFLPDSQEISVLLVNNKMYEVQSNVPQPIFESYVNWWVHGTVPDITLNNYYDYCILNQEFKIDFIDSYLKSKKDLFNDFEQNILMLKDDINENKPMVEHLVSMNIDLYLIRYPNDIMSLPIQQLCRLFGNPDCALKDHKKAYNLIMGKYNETNNPDYFILLPFLNGNELNSDILEECFQKKEERNNFLPKFNYKSIEDSLNKKDVKISELENQLQVQSGKVNNLFRLFLDDQYALEISNFLLPKEKEWNKINVNEFSFSDDETTYTLKTSSTLDDSDNYALPKLLNGKNELENGGVWSTKHCENCTIEIKFSKAVCADVIYMTSRNTPYSNEAPACFDVLARNGDDEEFALIKKIYVLMWNPNERKVFVINNSKCYHSYKLVFNACAYRDSNGSCYSLAEFNLGKIQL